jgi:hypothetical protein
MIKATVILSDGNDVTLEIHNWDELNDRLRGLDIKEVYAKKVKPSEIRQGRTY